MITGKYSQKPYRCTQCGRQEMVGTNHWGEIYPWCQHCNTITVWECLEPMPEGFTKPAPWRICKLGDVCTVETRRIDAVFAGIP